MLFALVFLIFCGVLDTSCEASPDLEKAYNDGVNWAQDMQKKQAVPGKRCAVGALKTPCMQGLQTEMPETKEVRQISHHRKTEDEILVFITFALPKLSLQKLRQQAAALNESGHVHVKLIARGLIDDSFKKTAVFLMEENKKGGKEHTNKSRIQGTSLNPRLFTEYSVTVSPTFVYLKKGKPVKRLSGNVCLDFVCQKFGLIKNKKVQV